MMNALQKAQVLDVTGASSISGIDHVQTLWSGYGEISRVWLDGSPQVSVIVKRVQLPERAKHPRGWHGERSHQRKLRSYAVESAWYRTYAARCHYLCRVPHCLWVSDAADALFLILEDLSASGFSRAPNTYDLNDLVACLRWLAHFHAQFMGSPGEDLWPIGTYWHLDTRPDEWAALADQPLKEAAHEIDAMLNAAQFKTLVHGDAKLANFCFANHGTEVAAVDFQYVGRGCGMKDVAYLIGSFLDEQGCETHEQFLLDAYFSELAKGLIHHQPHLVCADVEAAWRPLFYVAWADFHRFIKGWSPVHWKIHPYSERITENVIKRLSI